MVEEVFKSLEENDLVDEEARQGKKEMEESKKILNACQTKLSEMEKLSISEQIKVIKEV